MIQYSARGIRYSIGGERQGIIINIKPCQNERFFIVAAITIDLLSAQLISTRVLIMRLISGLGNIMNPPKTSCCNNEVNKHGLSIKSSSVLRACANYFAIMLNGRSEYNYSHIKKLLNDVNFINLITSIITSQFSPRDNNVLAIHVKFTSEFRKSFPDLPDYEVIFKIKVSPGGGGKIWVENINERKLCGDYKLYGKTLEALKNMDDFISQKKCFFIEARTNRY
ncbi:TPA: hypothetical protein RY503_003772 [Escherichia albertii]|nr:hypothetical protein [Escherichia albertii]HCS7460975.1 hypothetical protein [Escherichia albertii]HEB1070248.1 hypothetical protein [Escherichia albertii]HEB1089004.1 hypothetical protein [Escherichia albertii]HEB1117884.1 hypothetical protein [Escherichia albertii]